jgi:hypothetical protein
MHRGFDGTMQTSTSLISTTATMLRISQCADIFIASSEHLFALRASRQENVYSEKGDGTSYAAANQLWARLFQT